MTTAEDRDQWERDEEALRAHASAQISTHSPDEGSRVVPDPARVARHSVANWNTSDGVKWRWSCTCGVGDTVEFVSAYTGVAFGVKGEVGALLAKAALDRHIESAVADEERAALVELVREMGREAVAEAEAYRAVLARAEAAEAEVGRLRALVQDSYPTDITNHAFARADAAEAKVAKVEALADEWERGAPGLEWNVPIGETFAASLRAALADAPAEQRAEGGA